jgi:hypothetical protein
MQQYHMTPSVHRGIVHANPPSMVRIHTQLQALKTQAARKQAAKTTAPRACKDHPA